MDELPSKAKAHGCVALVGSLNAIPFKTKTP